MSASLLVPGGADGARHLCERPAEGTVTVVERVIDGDTVVLADGERVRIIGLDAPEFGRDGAPDGEFAREAAALLGSLLDASGNEAFVAPGEEARDRYGRLLARLHTPLHGDLAGHLILAGHAYAVAIAPNTTGTECHMTLERRARAAGRGLWSDPGARITPAERIDDTGFAIIDGTVRSVRERRDGVLLELTDMLSVRVLDGTLEDPGGYVSRRVEVRGWVHPWTGGTRAVTVSHPEMIRVIRTDGGG